MQNVVVTGYGAITPIGNNISDFKQNLFDGKSGCELITHFDASEFATQFACEIKNYTPTNYFEKKEISKLDLFTQYALIASREAIAHANLNNNQHIDKNRIGVIASSGVGGVGTFQEEMYKYWQHKNPRHFSPYFVTKMIVNNIAGHISIENNFTGLNFAVASACASSAHALVSAVQNIQLGKADIIVVCGSEAPIHEAGVGSFAAMRALSTNNINYKKASKPFDKNRDGFVLGEGAACLIVESKNHAIKRNAKIVAEIVGYNMNADAYHIAKPIESGENIAINMQQCLNDAKLNAKDINCINAHATATPLGDLAELNAIQHVFDGHLKNINITAPKSIFLLFLLGAAGIVESVASIFMIEEQKVSPTIHLENKDDRITEDFNLTEINSQSKKIDYILNNNFGFGGHNVSIIFKRYNV